MRIVVRTAVAEGAEELLEILTRGAKGLSLEDAKVGAEAAAAPLAHARGAARGREGRIPPARRVRAGQPREPGTVRARVARYARARVDARLRARYGGLWGYYQGFKRF